MSKFSLRQAATASGVSKSTILRAIQSGRMSASRTDTGGYEIDPAELFRVYPATARDALRDTPAGHNAPPSSADGTAVAQQPVHTLQTRVAVLEAELSGLRETLQAERRRADETAVDRDAWRSQAERLTLPAPKAAPERPGFLARLFGGKVA
jgi:hypothetical protein